MIHVVAVILSKLIVLSCMLTNLNVNIYVYVIQNRFEFLETCQIIVFHITQIAWKIYYSDKSKCCMFDFIGNRFGLQSNSARSPH